MLSRLRPHRRIAELVKKLESSFKPSRIRHEAKRARMLPDVEPGQQHMIELGITHRRIAGKKGVQVATIGRFA